MFGISGGIRAALVSKCIGCILTLFGTRCRPIQFSIIITRLSSNVKKQRPPGGGRFLVDPSRVLDYNNWWASAVFCVRLFDWFKFR